MSILYPYMLWGLFAVLVPVIVHLFNFRRHKVVYFSNIATLKNIEQENRKTKKLKYVIVMIMRMLCIAGLVIAFAYPYKTDQKLKIDDDRNLVAIYIDNSLSMQSQSSEISLLEDARSAARSLVKSIAPSQSFVLLTNSRQPADEYPMSRDEMLMHIDAMPTEASPLKMNVLYENLQMIMRRNDFKSSSLFIYSDFQNNNIDFDGLVADSAIQVVAMPLTSDFQHNIYIDTVWLTSPVLQVGLANEVNVRIVNESDKEIKGLPVYFEIDGKAVAFNTLDIPANGRSEVAMQFVLSAAGSRKAVVSINDFPITYDDKYNFILNVRPVIKIQEIGQKNQKSPLEIVFSGDSMFNYRLVDPHRIDQQYLADCQMVVVSTDINATMRQTLIDFVSDGGNVVFFPSDEVETFDDTLNVNVIASQHRFFDDIFVNIPDNADLPKVFRHSQINRKEFDNMQTLIALQNGEPFMTMSRVGAGNIFFFASRLNKEWTNFADNALFVPTMYKMAMLSGQMGQISYTIGVDKELIINDLTTLSEGDVRIRDEKNMFEMIPVAEMRNNHVLLRLYDDFLQAGFYSVNKGDEVVETTAWNYSRKESEMKFLNNNEIDKMLKDNGLNVVAVMEADEIHSDDVMEVMVRRSTLWKSFIIMSLISLLIEILILRFWK